MSGRHFLLLMFGLLVAFGLYYLSLFEAGVIVAGDSTDRLFNCRGCLRSLALSASDEGWGVGAGTFLLHLHHGQVSWVEGPGDHFLTAVALDPSGNGWAVGDAILRLHDGAWSQMRTLTGSDFLHAVSMPEASDGMAVGERSTGTIDEGLIYRYHDGAWTLLSLIPDVSLYGVSMTSPDDGWAVGERWSGGDAVGSVLLHYSDARWMPVPGPASASFSAVAMRSQTDGWLIGSGPGGGQLYRYVDRTWTLMQTEPGITLTSIAVSASGEAWAAGMQFNGAGDVAQSVLYHFNGTAWQSVRLSRSETYAEPAPNGPSSALVLSRVRAPIQDQGILIRIQPAGSQVMVLPRKPPDAALLRLLFPLALVSLSLMCLAAVVALWRALHTPAPSLWRPHRTRLGLACVVSLLLGPEIILLVGVLSQNVPLILQIAGLALMVLGWLALMAVAVSLGFDRLRRAMGRPRSLR